MDDTMETPTEVDATPQQTLTQQEVQQMPFEQRIEQLYSAAVQNGKKYVTFTDDNIPKAPHDWVVSNTFWDNLPPGYMKLFDDATELAYVDVLKHAKQLTIADEVYTLQECLKLVSKITRKQTPIYFWVFKEPNDANNCRTPNALNIWFIPLLKRLKDKLSAYFVDHFAEDLKIAVESNLDYVAEIAPTFDVTARFLFATGNLYRKEDRQDPIDLNIAKILQNFNLPAFRSHAQEVVLKWFPGNTAETLRQAHLDGYKNRIEVTEHKMSIPIDLETIPDTTGMELDDIKKKFEEWLSKINAGLPDEPLSFRIDPKDMGNKFKKLTATLELISTGWARLANSLKNRIVTKADKALNRRQDRLLKQAERISNAYDKRYCYVKSGRTLLNPDKQKGSEVQIRSIINAAQPDATKAVLYDWATGTGKTSAVWCEIFAAMSKGIQHAYISVVRWGTATEIYTIGLAAQGPNHIRNIADELFEGEPLTVSEIRQVYKQKGRPFVKYFDVTVGTRGLSLRVYMARRIDWKDVYSPETYYTKNTSKKTFEKNTNTRPEWFTEEKRKELDDIVLRPIVENLKRIFIVDEAHELRINDIGEHIAQRELDGLGGFRYKHADPTLDRLVAPESWNAESNRVLHVMRGDVTVKGFENLQSENNLMRAVYLTATPISQNWKNFYSFLASMYVVTQSNNDLQQYGQEYTTKMSGFTEKMEEINNKIEKRKTKQLNRVQALKQARAELKQTLEDFGISVSLDLASSEDMPYTNFSMTTTGVAYNGLTLSRNDPIIVDVEERHVVSLLERMEDGTAKDDAAWYWAMTDSASAWIDSFSSSPQQSAAPWLGRKPSIKRENSLQLRERLTCAVYCFQRNGVYYPFPPIMQDNLFKIEQQLDKLYQQRRHGTRNALVNIFQDVDKETKILQKIYELLGEEMEWNTDKVPTGRGMPTTLNGYLQVWQHLCRTMYYDSTGNRLNDSGRRVDKDGNEFDPNETPVPEHERTVLRRFLESKVKCFTHKLDMIAHAVKENVLSPSMVFFLQKDMGGAKHFVMVLEALGFENIALEKYTDVNGNHEIRNRCALLSGIESAESKDGFVQEGSLFNDHKNAHGEYVRCIIFLKGAAASITLRNILVCHYPVDDYIMLEYVQSLGRIARRSNFSANGMLFGFSAEAHGLVEQDDSQNPETFDDVNAIFQYDDNTPLQTLRRDPVTRTFGQKNKIVRVPVCSYITYKLKQKSLDDHYLDISLNRSIIYSIIQLSFASLSQNCLQNSTYFGRITNTEDFGRICESRDQPSSGDWLMEARNLITRYYKESVDAIKHWLRLNALKFHTHTNGNDKPVGTSVDVFKNQLKDSKDEEYRKISELNKDVLDMLLQSTDMLESSPSQNSNTKYYSFKVTLDNADALIRGWVRNQIQKPSGFFVTYQTSKWGKSAKATMNTILSDNRLVSFFETLYPTPRNRKDRKTLDNITEKVLKYFADNPSGDLGRLYKQESTGPQKKLLFSKIQPPTAPGSDHDDFLHNLMKGVFSDSDDEATPPPIAGVSEPASWKVQEAFAPLDSDEEKLVLNVWNKDMTLPDANVKLNDIGDTEITVTSIRRLNPSGDQWLKDTAQRDKWLDDDSMNGYMKIIVAQTRTATHRIAAFSSFFYAKLFADAKTYDYSQVERWYQKENVCSLDTVLIPINLLNSHWVFAVIRVQQRIVEYRDSMPGTHGQEVFNNLVRYMKDKCKKTSPWTFRDISASVPRQNNGYDCGVYVLLYANCVAHGVPLTTESFTPNMVTAARRRIAYELITWKGSDTPSSSQGEAAVQSSGGGLQPTSEDLGVDIWPANGSNTRLVHTETADFALKTFRVTSIFQEGFEDDVKGTVFLSRGAKRFTIQDFLNDFQDRDPSVLWDVACNYVRWMRDRKQGNVFFKPIEQETVLKGSQELVTATGENGQLCQAPTDWVPLSLFYIMYYFGIRPDDELDVTPYRDILIQDKHIPENFKERFIKAGDLLNTKKEKYSRKDNSGVLTQPPYPYVVLVLETRSTPPTPCAFAILGFKDFYQPTIVAIASDPTSQNAGGRLMSIITQSLFNYDNVVEIQLESINSVYIADTAYNALPDKTAVCLPGDVVVPGRKRLNEYYQRLGFQNIDNCVDKKPQYQLGDDGSVMRLCRPPT